MKTYDRRRERAVQPPPTLADELGRGLGHVRLGLARLDVRERPLFARLRDELKAEDAVLGEEHVLREDVHAVYPLGPEAVRERVVAVEVLLERLAEDGAVPVRGEGAGEDGDVAEGRFGGLVEDV